MGKIRGTNSSPGLYTKIEDVAYASKTLGITTLGLAGETLMGPAFEPIKVTDWPNFVTYFGGTSPELFKDSRYPKYELPYIAKSYLTKSDQLYVCRVLGLSGYNAGPAFAIYGKDSNSEKKYIIAILRSRGKYKKYANVGTECEPISAYDILEYDCDEITLTPYKSINSTYSCGQLTGGTVTGETKIKVSQNNYGMFCIEAKKSGKTIATIPVSLNPGSNDYIYNVLGSTPGNESKAPVFVEELYDVYLAELINKGEIDEISTAVKIFNEEHINDVTEPITAIMTIPSKNLSTKEIGKEYLSNGSGQSITGSTGGTTYEFEYYDGTETKMKPCALGTIYTVKRMFIDDKTEIVYVPKIYEDDIYDIYSTTTKQKIGDKDTVINLNQYSGFTDYTPSVKVESENTNYFKVGSGDTAKLANTYSKDMADKLLYDYKEEFRCAMTPWFVSELRGSGTNINVKRLFRFYTINDGESSNTQIKVSIENIRPDEGLFDVVIRDFYDSDSITTVLESFKNLNMIPGDSNYIGYKMGTLDGTYALKSKYVLTEVNEGCETSVPCGFLGYPIRYYGTGFTAPEFEYNTYYYDELKPKKQYFGLSDLNGIDVDMLSYKGRSAYHDNDLSFGYTKPFHMDARINPLLVSSLAETGNTVTVTVDEEEIKGLVWETVSPNNVTKKLTNMPEISSEERMENTIYSDKKLRKFTVCFYGGFDGWDIYRGSRTNTDDFKANRYKGTIARGNGRTFSNIIKSEGLSLTGNCINSDYYAYLAGINQFENPDKYEINIFATPGIDYVNNTLLVDEAFDMLEEKRQDSIYVVTTPDKPFGASDSSEDMYTGSDASENLEDTGIDTYYGCTYFAWVQYHDKANNKYLYLPPTKDVVRNMADVDNKKYPWYAPAGLERGNVECEKVKLFTKLDDENAIYDGRINPIKTFGEDGVKVWGNKSMYTGDTPMNRINTVRLVLYMRKLIKKSSLALVFDPNDNTQKGQLDSILRPILAQIKSDRGITDYKLNVSQTKEQMDAHEISATIFIKPTPTLEYIEISFVVTPQGVEFEDIK